jgi:NAD(P)-dependent dehydrogenase (short-subunit alcohol dehydrogenase family)
MEPGEAIILGHGSDIARGLWKRLIVDGWGVTGIGREKAALQTAYRWDLLISAIGTMEPIGKFFDLDPDEWAQSVHTNFVKQLRLLHTLWPMRAARPAVMFFAGGGTNGPFDRYSAYCVAKIALIKMVELLHHENPEANCFIIGPGYVKTKIHDETLRAGAAAGENLGKTKVLLEGVGTPIDDIYDHMMWCVEQGRDVAGGRNFSTVHDAWGTKGIVERLKNDPDMFRLRRRS